MPVSNGINIQCDSWALAIGPGDVVRHRPTGEQWVVAFVDGDRLWWCGWPEGQAQLSDCELIETATEEQRLSLLLRMAKSTGRRGEYAREVLSHRYDNQDLGEGEG